MHNACPAHKFKLYLCQTNENRTKEHFVEMYKKLIERIQSNELTVKNQVLDKEASKDYKELIKNKYIEYKLVLLGQYRRNIAERAIQTFKSNVISMLCGADDAFLMHL